MPEAVIDSRAIGSASAMACRERSPVEQVEARPLNLGYVETGPAGGPAAVLLHGWQYIHSYVNVALMRASAGYRVVVPYLRGYGAGRSSPKRRSAMTSNRRNLSTLLP